METERPPGQVITFYSYKGGTGRSMLVANAAWLLASVGKRVLLMDWDLEAPGLHRYFKPFLADPDLKETDGVIEWITDYWDAVVDSEDTDINSIIRTYADPRRYTVSLSTQDELPGKGGIDLMCAGRQDAAYSTAVGNFDFAKLYEMLQGADFMAATKSLLTGPEGYDFVLVDSRTGVSDTAGMCTVSLADTLVVCFTYNNQSIVGAANVARNARRQAEDMRRSSAVENERAYHLPYRVFGLPSRVDNLDPERLERRRTYAAEAFLDVVTTTGVQTNPEKLKTVIDGLVKAEIPYHPLYAYEEVLAGCMERIDDQKGVLGATQYILRLLTDGDLPTFPPLAEAQQRDLRERFAGGTSITPTATASSSWDFFCRHMPDEADREKLLDETFALLIQLVGSVATSSGSHSETSLLRSSLLESEISPDERPLLECALRAGIVCRRVSRSGERAIEIADDSILFSWTQLEQRLAQNLACVQQREALIGARRSWIASGRRISLLREVSDEVAAIEVVNERGPWLGNRSLDFLNAVKEAKAYSRREKELSDRLATSEDNLRFESDVRRQLERQLGQERSVIDSERMYSRQKLDEADSLRTTTFKLRHRTGIFVASVAAAVLFTAVIVYQRNERIQAEHLQQAAKFEEEALRANADAQRKLDLALEKAKSEEADRRLAMLQAAQPLTVGLDLSRLRRWKEANTQFSEAIRLDPTLAEAYFRRAVTSQHLGDSQKEMEDYASYFDLRPSLSGRVDLIQAMSRLATINDALFNRQLEAVLIDSLNQASRNISPETAAERLKSILDGANSQQTRLHADVEANLRRVISQLNPKAISAKSMKQTAVAQIEAAATNASSGTTNASSAMTSREKITDGVSSPVGAQETRSPQETTPSVSRKATIQNDLLERAERPFTANKTTLQMDSSNISIDQSIGSSSTKASAPRPLPTFEARGQTKASK